MKLLDESGNIPTVLVGKEAEKMADIFRRKKLSAHQLRRFYNDFKTLERKLERKTVDKNASADEVFQEILPLVMLNRPKVIYASSRNLVPNEFKDWLSSCVGGIKDAKTFQAFMLHFEAVVGFCGKLTERG